ncbi:tellurite resistance/C4-dicarboxylate transporter family protein [Streptomyces rimosus]|uniref:tellurite resistance/C4-dicarboxylate transporter family protein n=1 Tax=Streptomyces rimosus TaxID=1927 RepID=UPI00067D9D76|nr:tellurite resistance/C4-dicarboxylate transporter family protein [Streptomyces rimosus]
MAAGIVSRAAGTVGAHGVARVLLGVGVILYAGLVVATGWRIAAYRGRVARDAADPARAFGFFTFVAASDVLAADLAAGRWRPFAVALLTGGALSCAALVPRMLVTVARARSARPDGSWFLLVVGPQSVVVAGTALRAGPTTAVAEVCCWAAGVLAYVSITTLVWTRLRRHGVAPADLTPVYWIAMGAGAISVLAGADVLLSTPWNGPVRAVIVVVLTVVAGWATALIPVLLAAGAWRHVRHRVPLRYEPSWWSAVFPIGMYAVATHRAGRATGAGLWEGAGHAVAWAALGAWALAGAAVLVERSHRRVAE